jgi:glutathione S-transferase
VTRVLANLERWLADRTFVATSEFTVADACGGIMMRPPILQQ